MGLFKKSPEEGQTEAALSYPRDLVMRDGTVRRVNSAEEEAQAHIEDREAA
ncbi:MAG TPA: hypothetical protein VGQ87_02290 [Patescibacteria group bacterium]|jgi:hypothetical protein|nr:hypothetical protein [Patescibacteria group bacterium]